MRHVAGMELAMVSWSVADCPDVEYMVLLSGLILGDPLAGIEVTSYWTDHTFFEFPLPCGTSYNIRVLAQDSAGISDLSEAISGTTGTRTSISVGKLHRTVRVSSTENGIT